VRFDKQITLIWIVLYVFIFFGCRTYNIKTGSLEYPFKGSEWYYRFYPWQEQHSLEKAYYPVLQHEIEIEPQQEKSSLIGPFNNPKQPLQQNQQNKTTSAKTKNPVKDVLEPSKPKKPGAIIHASLTSSPGSIAVSGTQYQVEIQIDGKLMKSEHFSVSTGSSFNIVAKGAGITRNIRVSSPSFGTNMMLSSLTLSINPFNNTASITGKLNLDLPGTMSGSLINLSNGSSSSCEVRQGYFSTSVALSMGNNHLTAIGKWLTITLELPSITVLVQ